MKDVDRAKVYNSQKKTAPSPPPDPANDDKELLVLEARLGRATGKDRMRIEEMIRDIRRRREREGH